MLVCWVVVAALLVACGGASERSKSGPMDGAAGGTAAGTMGDAGANGATDDDGAAFRAAVEMGIECGDGERIFVQDLDGDGWAGFGSYPGMICEREPPEDGWVPLDTVTGVDCNDADAGLTQPLYRVGWHAPLPGADLPKIEQRCVEDPDTEGFEPFDGVGYFGGYDCAFGFRPWGRDFDHDGVMGRSDDYLCLPGETIAPASYASATYAITWKYQDCDDEDGTLSAFGYTDADGDRYSSGGPRCIAWDEAGVTDATRSGGDDCDDNDATVFRIGYRDVDLDGARSDEPVCMGAMAPDGVVNRAHPLDCDDNDAGAHPGLEEIVADGVDQDCDGADAPACDQIGEWTDEVEEPRAECAGGSDLYLVWARGCPEPVECFTGTLIARIANRGEADFEGTATLVLEQEGTSVDIDVDIVVPAGEIVTVSSEGQNGGATRLRLLAPSAHCLRQDALEFELTGGTNCHI